MIKTYTIFIILTTFISFPVFSQTNSYTIWIGDQEIFTHHEMDAGDTVDVKKGLFTGKDTLIAQYLHPGVDAFGSSTRLTLNNELNRLIRGETIIQNQAFHKASIPISTILENWQLDTFQYLSISLVIHNQGETRARGYKVGVLRLVD